MYNSDGIKNNICTRLPFITESVALAVIPFEETLTLPIGSILRLINLITIFFCFIELKSTRIQRVKNSPIVPMLVFMFYALISYFWCFNTTYYFDRLSTYYLYSILIFFLCFLKPNKKEKDIMLTGLLSGGVLAAVMILFSRSSMDIGGRETIVIFGRMVDPNLLSYSCVLSLIICIHRLLIEKKNKILNILLSILLFIAIIICGSRGAFVTSFATITVIIMNVDFQNNKLVKKLLFIIFIFIIIISLYFDFVLTSEYGERFTIDNLIGQGSMGTANRDKIWSAAFTQIAKHPILGYGNGASMYAIEEVYRFYGTHNSYIMVLLEFGIVGFAIVFLWQFREYRLCSKDANKIYKFLFLSMFIFIVFVEGFATKVFWGLQVLLMTSCYTEKLKSKVNLTPV